MTVSPLSFSPSLGLPRVFFWNSELWMIYAVACPCLWKNGCLPI